MHGQKPEQVWAAQAVQYNDAGRVVNRVGGMNAGGELMVGKHGGEAEVVVRNIRHHGETREGNIRFTLTLQSAALLVAELRAVYGDKVLEVSTNLQM
jgi:hypothetical protein